MLVSERAVDAIDGQRKDTLVWAWVLGISLILFLRNRYTIAHKQKEIHFLDWIFFFYILSEKADIHNIRLPWYILILNIINVLNYLGYKKLIISDFYYQLEGSK